MANTKKIIAEWSETGKTVYCIIRREADNFLLDDATGSFGAAPADPYVSLTEDGTIKGLYQLNESRQVWNDGRYTIAVYKQAGGSPSPVADTIIGSGDMFIIGDSEVAQSSNILRTGIAQAGGANSITLDAGASSINSFYNWCAVMIVAGTGAGQVQTIFQYNGTTKVVSTFGTWQTAPDNTSVFMIIPAGNTIQNVYQTFNNLDKLGYATDLEIRKNYLQPGSTTTTINLDAGASSIEGAYVGCIILFTTGVAAGLFGTIQSYLAFPKQAILSSALLVAPGGGDQFVIYPSGGATAAAIDAQLTGSHGAGSWAGATPAQIDTQLSGTHGTGQWGLGSGAGDTGVNHNTPTADAMRIVNQSGQGIADVRIIAYLQSDYLAGNSGTSFIKGSSITGVDGRWLTPIMLQSGNTYVIVFSESGYKNSTQTITI